MWRIFAYVGKFGDFECVILRTALTTGWPVGTKVQDASLFHQGDQMRLQKWPKCSPTHFLFFQINTNEQNLYIPRKNVAQNLGFSCNKKIAQNRQSPNRRKFSKSNHPAYYLGTSSSNLLKGRWGSKQSAEKPLLQRNDILAGNTFWSQAGWADEFFENIAQSVAQYIICQI
jgi:hypothetical protein